MQMKEVMQQQRFAVVGDTLNTEKFACKIKYDLRANGYTAWPVGKEMASINDIPEEIDIIDLCINPKEGIRLLKECEKEVKCVVIQPGAESEEIIDYLTQKEIPYLEDCVWRNLKHYPIPETEE